MASFTPAQLRCRVCGEPSSLFDVVDFNRSCEEARGLFLDLAGTAVYYARCAACGFCFAPEFSEWSLEDFRQRIYNDGYAQVDPDYLESRPRGNAALLSSLFGAHAGTFRHLDYGGGNGALAGMLQGLGWESSSYDPFVDLGTRVEDLGRFDLVTAFEVFEHVPDVRRLMDDLSTLRAADGIVLFSTLLSDDHIRPQQRLSWCYAAPRNGHVSLFSKRSLALLAQSAHVNFGSFNQDLHAFFAQVPPWARHVIRVGA